MAIFHSQLLNGTQGYDKPFKPSISLVSSTHPLVFLKNAGRPKKLFQIWFFYGFSMCFHGFYLILGLFFCVPNGTPRVSECSLRSRSKPSMFPMACWDDRWIWETFVSWDDMTIPRYGKIISIYYNIYIYLFHIYLLGLWHIYLSVGIMTYIFVPNHQPDYIYIYHSGWLLIYI
jgi:hypothetical protein